MIFIKDKKRGFFVVLFWFFLTTNIDVAATLAFFVRIFNFCDVYVFLLKNVLVENFHVPSLTIHLHNKFINGTKYPFLIHKPLGYCLVCDFFSCFRSYIFHTGEKTFLIGLCK